MNLINASSVCLFKSKNEPNFFKKLNYFYLYPINVAQLTVPSEAINPQFESRNDQNLGKQQFHFQNCIQSMSGPDICFSRGKFESGCLVGKGTWHSNSLKQKRELRTGRGGGVALKPWLSLSHFKYTHLLPLSLCLLTQARKYLHTLFLSLSLSFYE